jgi:hypothetical protein
VGCFEGRDQPLLSAHYLHSFKNFFVEGIAGFNAAYFAKVGDFMVSSRVI